MNLQYFLTSHLRILRRCLRRRRNIDIRGLGMNSKERMITAFLNQKPDRVPVAPDISCMIPARLTGKPFWDVFYYNNPPLWKAYIEAVKKFGFDAWFIYAGDLKDSKEDKREFEDKIILKNEDRLVVRTTIHTPEGDLWYETT